MTARCSTERLEFGRLRRQRVVSRFNGGELGPDGGGLLLREPGLWAAGGRGRQGLLFGRGADRVDWLVYAAGQLEPG